MDPVAVITEAYVDAILENLNWSKEVYSNGKPGEYDQSYMPHWLLESIRDECAQFHQAARPVLDELEQTDWGKGDPMGRSFLQRVGRALWAYRIEDLSFSIGGPWEIGKKLDRIANTLPKGRYLFRDNAGQINSRTP